MIIALVQIPMENAEAWFNGGWADWMEGRFGVRPTLTIFDNPVVLDNEAGEVRVTGEVRDGI